MNLYLDASVIVPAFIDEPTSASVTRLIDTLVRPALLSDFSAGEFVSAISRRYRMALLTLEGAQAKLADFERWSDIVARPLPILTTDIAAATALVRRFELKLRLPDATHLAVCQRRGLTLATLDDQLANAARALGVAHIVPA